MVQGNWKIYIHLMYLMPNWTFLDVGPSKSEAPLLYWLWPIYSWQWSNNSQFACLDDMMNLIWNIFLNFPMNGDIGIPLSNDKRQHKLWWKLLIFVFLIVWLNIHSLSILKRYYFLLLYYLSSWMFSYCSIAFELLTNDTVL